MGALSFRTLLAESGLDLAQVRLARHKEALVDGMTPYRVWRDSRDDFDMYQSTQGFVRRSELQPATHLASFLGTPEGRTLFVGVYSSRYIGVLGHDLTMRCCPWTAHAGSCDAYEQALTGTLSEYIGRLFIKWGPGYRKWTQRAHKHEKPIVALYESYADPAFPGFSLFSQPLSTLASLPATWKSPLAAVGGVYLLTCPREGKQYVGSAYGAGGFMGRWSAHVWTGGDAVALRERKPEDYRVSILEVLPDTTPKFAVFAAEDHWKVKLGTRVHGLNRN